MTGMALWLRKGQENHVSYRSVSLAPEAQLFYVYLTVRR